MCGEEKGHQKENVIFTIAIFTSKLLNVEYFATATELLFLLSANVGGNVLRILNYEFLLLAKSDIQDQKS